MKMEQCYQKAIENGEHTFTLRSQDKSSSRTIAFWILENIETCPPEKLHKAIDDAVKMREWQFRKNAD